ncbi:MAG: small multi-drug export protein [Methanomicrobiales archaeon]|nr:small multi-drug export protein [Methanomicrobiales archaeon]MDD1654578.1 small multi-drug export protein [Methanomicrobiales archaeon]
MEVASALTILLLGAIPLFEARYAIPAALVAGYQPVEAFLLGLAGNLLPIIPLLLLLGPVSDFLIRHSALADRFFRWLFERTRAKLQGLEKVEALALFAFVAVPLPMTGAWSGCVVAFIFDVPFRYALPAIALGAVVAALVTTLPTLGFLSLVR